MATSKEYLRFVLDRLSDLEGISYKQMMGEYIIYYKGKLAAYVCDNRVLIKPVKSALSLMPEAPLQAPYEGAKEMLLAENIDDRDFMTELFRAIYDDFLEPKPKKKR